VRALPSGTVTFLFTDIEGSTRLLHEHGERYAELLAEHRRILRDAFLRYGGVEVDTQGDAFFVAFPRADDAVAAAAEVQAALEEPVRVRIGIHTGQPIVTDEGYVGMDVHKAARIAAAGHGGQVLVSQQTAVLAGSAGLCDLGEHRLKDLSAPERLYQLGDDDFPALKTLYRTTLPVQPNSLVGRERELAEVIQLLRAHQLVTIIGPGGTGKTRLALQAAAESVDDFADGVLWVPLAALTDPAIVEPTVAQIIGAKDGAAKHIGEKRMLLLLDNLEQLLPEAALRLGELAAACPNLRLLLTSRAPLRIVGEHEFAVDPLPETDAVTLFRERAFASEPESAVREICRRLDGLPLAIELAAARTRLLAPNELLERLDERLSLLTRGPRDAPERQQTLRATIEWSYDLLSPEEQQLFARVAVFGASFDLEAAEVVCDADLDTLGSLIEQSLVRRWGSGRFGMLGTIREFALDRLKDEAKFDDVSERQAAFFNDLALRAEPNLAGPTLGPWLERLAADHSNLRTAVEWCLAAGRADGALRTVVALARYLEARGHFAEGRTWLSEALGRDPDVPAALKARATYVLGRLVDSQADFAQARQLYEEALTTYRELGDREGAAEAMIELVWAVMQQGELAEACRLGEEALSLARDLGDPATIANALVNHGGTLVELGRYADGLRCYEESLALRRPLREARSIAISLGCIGWTSLLAGDLDRAKTAAGEAVELMRRNADRQWVGASLHTLGAVALAEGDVERAASLFLAALSDAEELGDRRAAPECLLGLAAVSAEQGKDEAAARLDGAAEALFAETGVAPSPVVVSIRREQLANARARIGDERWGRSVEAGRWLSLEEAVRFARGKAPE
jgi:predicted ATPase